MGKCRLWPAAQKSTPEATRCRRSGVAGRAGRATGNGKEARGPRPLAGTRALTVPGAAGPSVRDVHVGEGRNALVQLPRVTGPDGENDHTTGMQDMGSGVAGDWSQAADGNRRHQRGFTAFSRKRYMGNAWERSRTYVLRPNYILAPRTPERDLPRRSSLQR